MAAVLGPGGPSIAILFATDGPGGPILGDHLWHDSPRQPRYSRDLEKLLRNQQSISAANLHVPFPHKVYVPIHEGPRKCSVPSLIVSRAESP